MTKMTISQYAELLGVTRDAIHKRIKHRIKLKGVTKKETVGNITILYVDEEKARA